MGHDYLQELKTGHIISSYLKGALEEAHQGKYKIAEIRTALLPGLDNQIAKAEQEIQKEKAEGRKPALLEKRLAEDKQRKYDLLQGRETTFCNGRIKIPIR